MVWLGNKTPMVLGIRLAMSLLGGQSPMSLLLSDIISASLDVTFL